MQTNRSLSRSCYRLSVALFVLAGLFGPVGCSCVGAQPPESILIELEVEGDTAVIRSVRELPGRPAASGADTFRLRSRAWTAFPAGASEYVVLFFDQNGRPVGPPHGFSARADRSFERVVRDGRRPRLAGTSGDVLSGTRFFHVGVPADAASFAIVRIDIVAAADFDSTAYDSFRPGPMRNRIRGVDLIGGSGLPGGGGGAGGGLGGVAPPMPEPLDPPYDFMIPEDFPWSELPDIFDWPFDRIESDTCHYGGKVDTCFNIVIVGDGFTAGAEQDSFRLYADTLCHKILHTSPYERITNQFNIFKVSTRSAESGITDCSGYDEIVNYLYEHGTCNTTTCCANEASCAFPISKTIEVDTYFESYGNAVPTGGNYFGYCNTNKGAIYDVVADELIDYDDVDLYILILNCRADGGNWLGDKVMTVTLPGYWGSTTWAIESFLEVAMHEMGHGVGGLKEEYTSCTEWDPLVTSYKNVVRHADIDDAPWDTLATDVDGAGNLTIRHYGPDHAEACDGTHNLKSPPASMQRLGAYWGAQFIDMPSGFSCGDGCETAANWDWQGDENGQLYYRPAATCRMRFQDVDFCRACDHYVEQRILEE